MAASRRPPGAAARDAPDVVNEVLPRLRDRELGADSAVITLRLTGIGESAVAEVLGERCCAAAIPRWPRMPGRRRSTCGSVRSVRIARVGRRRNGSMRPRPSSASGSVGTSGPRATRAGPTAVGERLTERGWRLAIEEIGTAGQVAVLFGDVAWLELAVSGDRRTRPPAEGDEAGLISRAASVRHDARGRCRPGDPHPSARERHRGDRGGRRRRTANGVRRDRRTRPATSAGPGGASRGRRAVRGAERRPLGLLGIPWEHRRRAPDLRCYRREVPIRPSRSVTTMPSRSSRIRPSSVN